VKFSQFACVSRVEDFPVGIERCGAFGSAYIFPFDFSMWAGVSEEFINEFGASLSSLVPFSGGGKRPSIPVDALQPGDVKPIIDTIFSFVAKAASK
jgi:hypothetical protein